VRELFIYYTELRLNTTLSEDLSEGTISFNRWLNQDATHAAFCIYREEGVRAAEGLCCLFTPALEEGAVEGVGAEADTSITAPGCMAVLRVSPSRLPVSLKCVT
jgi:nicotinate-nucleotide pyrophosphorylase